MSFIEQLIDKGYLPVKDENGNVVGKTKIKTVETILDKNIGLPIGYKINDEYDVSLGAASRLLNDTKLNDLKIIE